MKKATVNPLVASSFNPAPLSVPSYSYSLLRTWPFSTQLSRVHSGLDQALAISERSSGPEAFPMGTRKYLVDEE